MKILQLFFLLMISMAFIACGEKITESSSNNYSTVNLDFLAISDEQTVQTGSGINFKVIPEVKENIYVYFYDPDGGLVWEKIDIDSDGNYACSYDSYNDEYKWISCTLINSASGGNFVFTLGNKNQTPITFKTVAFQNSSNDGNSTNPVALTLNSSAESYVGDFGSSYYTFTKSGTGVVNISVAQNDSMTDTAENIVWNLTDSSGNAVTNSGGTLTQLAHSIYFLGSNGSSCSDGYSDLNISCSTSIPAGTYNIEVKNVSDSPFTKYMITVNK